jgi:DNA-binding CsgD family transcriptional regulator
LQVAWKLQLLDGARITGFEVLDRLGIGVALLDNQGRPLFLKAVVDRLVSSGRWLTVVNGTLQPVHRAKRGAFAAAIDASALTSGGTLASAGGLVRLPDPVHGALVVTIAPFRSQDLAIGQGNPAALVQFSDPDHPRGPQEKVLRVAYELSRGEARLVSALAGGERLADYAKQAGVSVNTARTQLARAFAKTGTARQTDLIIKVTAELSGLMAAEKKDPV